MRPSEIISIGRNKYNYLMQLDTLTQEQESQVKNYEKQGSNTSPEQAQKIASYLQGIREPKSPPECLKFTYKQLYKAFKRKFFELEGEEFIENERTIENIKPLIYYFARHDNFGKCENLRTKFDFSGGKRISKPSFDKGLLIIGGFGNGKTSSMRVLRTLLKDFSDVSYVGYQANDVVALYESLGARLDKNEFWKKMCRRDRVYFDDVKTERKANNYGQVNIFKDVLETREERGLLTHITCNYKKGFHGNVEEGLNEFGQMYEGRVWDRLFRMFNVVEFKGVSFR